MFRRHCLPAAGPVGEILPDVVAEALRQGAALLACFPKHKPDAVESQKCEDGGACFGDTIEAELSARAERSGWNTSVQFLEKTGAVRLRLVRQPEKGDDNRPRTNGRGGDDGVGV